MSERVLDPDGRLVTVRCRSAAPALELRGELPHWAEPVAMTPVGAGWHEARLRVGPGVYEVKLRAGDDAWSLDPAWPVIARGEARDGLLVVGGAAPPVVHAPASPWLVRWPDGRVVVRAAAPRGLRLALRVDEGDGAFARAMRAVGDDGDHVVLEATLSGAGRRVEYAFVLGDGRVIGDAAGAAFRIELADLPAPPPAWWRDGVVYSVLVDRFRRGDGAWASPRWDRDHRAGGDLDGVAQAIPYLRDLGVTVVHLTPLVPSPSAHRYDAIDPRAVAEELGGDAALERLLATAHAAGLRVIADVAVTHVDRDFAPFREVRARGPASPYWRWFRAHRWPFFDGPDPGYQHYQKGQWREPLLALDEPEVGEHLCETVASWIRRGLDGVRIDAAADLPVPLVARLRAAARAARPRGDVLVFGEVVPACVERWVPGALDAATDFAAREAWTGWLRGATPAAELVAVTDRQRRRGVAGPTGLGFTGTHDQPRIATVTGDPALARLGLLAVALGARVPLLYYGDEIGLAADPAARDRAFEDSWPDRQPMPWDPAAWDTTTLALVRDALGLRRDREVLRAGDERVAAIGEVVWVRRGAGADVIDVLFNRGAATEVALPAGDDARVLLVTGDAALDGARVRLGARAAIVLDRRRAATDDDLALRIHNAGLAAEAYVAGHVVTPAYPSRLYVTVTEACNLRCAHCITDAPARTRAGTARTVAPWLLGALDEAFAHADYVAFTHGGESLAAPGFADVLRRIQRARAGRPGRADVHLVSNGTLLDAERLRALIELGVTSLMISLDGATAATNDRIRVLGRFDTVIANLAAAVQLRAALGVDLRIGVSTVVGRSNVAELPALGRRCLELGVDWLKVEETYPATPFARHDGLEPTGPEVSGAVAALHDAVAGHPLVIVDHLAPPDGCPCGDDPDRAIARFRAADDHANRARFRPCRAAWEQAAIDPDGTLHAVDYAGPPLGSLLDADFLSLWNAPPAQRLRERALAAQPPARRRRCVGS